MFHVMAFRLKSSSSCHPPLAPTLKSLFYIMVFSKIRNFNNKFIDKFVKKSHTFV